MCYLIKYSAHLKGGKCIRSDVKCGHLHVAEEIFKVFRVEDDFGERFVPDALTQHNPTIQCHLRGLIPATTSQEKCHVHTHINA